jgi:putative peptidoglycan lipid II flippase
MDEMTHRVIGRVIGLIIPFSAVMMVLSHQIIAVLFQHGQFDNAATERTAAVLSLYLIGAFTGAASTIVVRGFYALQQTLYPMILSTVVTLASVPLYWILAQRMGARGVALAGAVFMVVQFLVLYIAWARRHSQSSQAKALGLCTVKTVLAAVVGAAISYAIKEMVSESLLHTITTMRLAQMAIGMCAGIPGLGVAFGLLGWWGVIDIRMVLRKKKSSG